MIGNAVAAAAIQILIAAMSGLAGAWALLHYVVRKSVDVFTERELTRYKGQLKAQSDAALESQKASLRQATDAFVARVGTLYQRRLDVLADGYPKLVAVVGRLERYLNPVKVYPPEMTADEAASILRSEASTAFQDYFEYFDRHRIFFDESTIERLDRLNDLIRDALANYTGLGQTREQRNRWEIIHASIKHDGTAAVEELRRDFGRLLGVEQRTTD
jgi:hypothetical protein